uniref:Uncharacterized protein n=1 Tax=Ciona savignyi TaxID=51511 RepID=H2YGV4_CIOSA
MVRLLGYQWPRLEPVVARQEDVIGGVVDGGAGVSPDSVIRDASYTLDQFGPGVVLVQVPKMLDVSVVTDCSKLAPSIPILNRCTRATKKFLMVLKLTS